MLVGYMCVLSKSNHQTTTQQRDALLATGVDDCHLHENWAGGARDDRPGLDQALEFVRRGNCLVIWEPDRPGRFLPHLLPSSPTYQGAHR